MGDWENTIPGLVYLQSRIVRGYDNVGDDDGENDAVEGITPRRKRAPSQHLQSGW